MREYFEDEHPSQVVECHKGKTFEDRYEPGNYVVGANIAGFVKVVEAMIDQGLV